MRKKLIAMRESLGVLVEEMRTVNDLALSEDREYTSDETESYAKMEKDFESLEKRIGQAERQSEIEAKIKGDNKFEQSDENFSKDDDERSDSGDVETRAFNKFLTGSRNFNEAEARALQADADIYGGYIVAPEKYVNKLITAMDNSVFVRQHATKHTLKKAASLGVPSLDNDPADPIWTAEIGTGDEDSTMSFGKREMNPHPLAKRIKVSKTLLARSSMGVEGIVRGRLVYKFAVTHENTFLNGHGNNQPLGLFTASDNGVTTSQDVSTDNTTTTITCDGLINALYDLKEGYQRGARWVFHRDAIKMIRKLKDGDGQYIWNPGITTDKPASILDCPYHTSEYAPNTFTTGQYVGLIGDLSFYWIVDALDMEIQRLNELYAETNQVGFIGRLETDGQPVLAEAFRRIKLA